MRKVFAFVLATALAVTSLCSCAETDSTSSATSSESVSNTVSYTAPEKIATNGNVMTEFAEATVSADITPMDIIEKETGLDSYSTTASWISETQILVAYQHTVMPMPNYPVKKLKLRVYDISSGAAEISAEKDLDDEFPVVKAYNGGCAVISKVAATFYDAALNVLSTYTVASENTLFDISNDGKTFAYADTDGNIHAILNGEDKLLEEKNGAVSAIAVSDDGKYIAYYRDKAPYTVDIASGTVTAVETGEVTLSSVVQIFWLGNDALFLDRPVAGSAKALASVLYSAETKASSYPSIGAEFENPYARGKFYEVGGKLYLAYGLCADNNSMGNLEFISYGEDFATTTVKEVASGYYNYNSYSYSEGGKLLINENLADLSEIKDYIHIF